MNKKVLITILAAGMFGFVGQANADFTVLDNAMFNAFQHRFVTFFGDNPLDKVAFDSPDDRWWYCYDYVENQGLLGTAFAEEQIRGSKVTNYMNRTDFSDPWTAFITLTFADPILDDYGYDLAIVGWDPASESRAYEVRIGGEVQILETQVILQAVTGGPYSPPMYGDPYMHVAVIDLADYGLDSISSLDINMTPLWGSPFLTAAGTLYYVPAPGAIVLGGLGIGLVGWLRRRRAL